MRNNLCFSSPLRLRPHVIFFELKKIFYPSPFELPSLKTFYVVVLGIKDFLIIGNNEPVNSSWTFSGLQKRDSEKFGIVVNRKDTDCQMDTLTSTLNFFLVKHGFRNWKEWSDLPEVLSSLCQSLRLPETFFAGLQSGKDDHLLPTSQAFRETHAAMWKHFLW